MDIKILDNGNEIREAFMNHFVLTWEEFQQNHHKWIAEMAKTDSPVNREWYERAYMWDIMDTKFPNIPMEEALSFLRKHNDNVLLMSEKDEDTYYQGERIVDFVIQAESKSLASQIEKEWLDSYKLTAQKMYDPDAFLPEDLYVFDSTMKWCVVFTHETADWESESDDPMKTAASRYCIMCEL